LERRKRGRRESEKQLRAGDSVSAISVIVRYEDELMRVAFLSARRTSVYPSANNMAATSGRRQSTFPGGVAATPAASYARPAAALKDTRPIKDKSWQKKARDDIFEFLEQHGYPYMMPERALIGPTTKEFQDIFRFLFNKFDNRESTTSLAPNKKFEDEVPILLRSAGYPFAADISKSHLQAIGAQHSWPGMLAMLHWFVEHVKVSEPTNA
jgi:kinetochore protein NDC80